MPLDAPLSHAEWKSIRRRCKLIPRRFSKKFIASELEERNKYRSIVRSVQKNPRLRPSKFRYNVYKPIFAGTAVKAYSNVHQTIQSGIVLSYDPAYATYLIEFEDEAYGYEYCPDTDVASNGTPIILFPKSVVNCHDELDGRFRSLQCMSPQASIYCNTSISFSCLTIFSLHRCTIAVSFHHPAD